MQEILNIFISSRAIKDSEIAQTGHAFATRTLSLSYSLTTMASVFSPPGFDFSNQLRYVHSLQSL
jgi:hypothetical protein